MQSMDPSIYRLRQRDVLTFCVLALLCLGIIMVQSASMNVSGQLGWRLNPLALKQFGFCIVGLAAFFLVGHIHYSRLNRENTKWWMNPVLWLLAITIALNLIVLVPHVGITRNGARRWLPLGFTQLQPSELAKWAIVIFLAWWL